MSGNRQVSARIGKPKQYDNLIEISIGAYIGLHLKTGHNEDNLKNDIGLRLISLIIKDNCVGKYRGLNFYRPTSL